eukprot:COSAG01_NODE_7928_length_2988_cov_102.404292_6_plen_71_part_00
MIIMTQRWYSLFSRPSTSKTAISLCIARTVVAANTSALSHHLKAAPGTSPSRRSITSGWMETCSAAHPSL